jgi:hypothetical protein
LLSASSDIGLWLQMAAAKEDGELSDGSISYDSDEATRRLAEYQHQRDGLPQVTSAPSQVTSTPTGGTAGPARNSAQP